MAKRASLIFFFFIGAIGCILSGWFLHEKGSFFWWLIVSSGVLLYVACFISAFLFRDSLDAWVRQIEFED